MFRKIIKWVLVILLILFFIYLIFAIFNRWFPFEGWPWPWPPHEDYPAEEFYLDGQVILAGLEDDVLLAVSGATNIQLNEIKTLRFEDLGVTNETCPSVPSSPDNGYVVALYEFESDDATVEEAIDAITGSNIAGSRISVEPNWISGAPWEPGGSPWEPGGSPWEAGGSTFDEDAVSEAVEEDFRSQWGFRTINHTISIDQTQPEEVGETGTTVRVGVFDTSPFDFGDVPTDSEWHTIEVLHTLPNSLALQIKHPEFVELPPSQGDPMDVSNHGLFVAGLIHGIAPNETDIHLIRVLNDDNRGSTFALIEQVFEFVKETVDLGEDKPPTLINLSLGIRIPPEEANFDLPTTVISLQYLFEATHCLDIVTVAAAGNNSANVFPPEPANIPAAWDTTIGVAASNTAGNRGCFSNRGQIAAPGGDGRRAEDGNANTECAPIKDCAECGVVGPVLKEDVPKGFIYWTGTSFAAPMVSGLAALLLHQDQELTPDMIEDIIMCSASGSSDIHLGKGVINIQQALEGCYEIIGETGEVEPPEACAPTDDGQFAGVDLRGQTVMLWHVYNGNLAETLLEIINEFNENNECGITIEPVNWGSYNELLEAVIVSIASGETPPTLVVGYQYHQALYQLNDTLVDLNDYLNDPHWGLSEEEQASFYQNIFNQSIHAAFDNQRLGFPINRFIELLHYNKTYLEGLGYAAPPTTPEEFIEISCAAAAASESGIGGYEMRNDASALAAWTFAFGGNIINENGTEYVYNGDATIQAMEMLIELATPGEDGQICAYPLDGSPYSAIASRQALFTMWPSNDIPFYVNEFSAQSDEYAVAAIPHTTLDPVVNVYGEDLMIVRTTPEQQLAAWEFIKWFTLPEVQARWVEATNSYPTHSETVEFLGDYNEANPVYAQALELLPFSAFEPQLASYLAVRDLVEEAFIDMIQGLNIQEALEGLTQDANNIPQ